MNTVPLEPKVKRDPTSTEMTDVDVDTVFTSKPENSNVKTKLSLMKNYNTNLLYIQNINKFFKFIHKHNLNDKSTDLLRTEELWNSKGFHNKRVMERTQVSSYKNVHVTFVLVLLVQTYEILEEFFSYNFIKLR